MYFNGTGIWGGETIIQTHTASPGEYGIFTDCHLVSKVSMHLDWYPFLFLNL